MGAGYIAARLDRFLVSASFMLRDLTLTSFTMPSAVSNHKSLSLVLSTPENLGPIPLKFNFSWIQEEKSMGLVKNAWGLACTGSPSYISESKRRNVHTELKSWVKTEYRNASSRKIRLQSRLAYLHSKIETKEIIPIIISQEKELNLKILKATRCEEEELRVKSRQLWLKGGDSNTEYFHKQIKTRINYIMIKELKDKDGNRIVDQEDIKACVF